MNKEKDVEVVFTGKEKTVSRYTTMKYKINKKTGLIDGISFERVITKEKEVLKNKEHSFITVKISKGYNEWNDEGLNQEKVYTRINSMIYNVKIDLNDNTVFINSFPLLLNKGEFKCFLILCNNCINAIGEPKYASIEELSNYSVDYEVTYKRMQKIEYKLKELMLHEDFLSILLNEFFDRTKIGDINYIITEDKVDLKIEKMFDYDENIDPYDANQINDLIDNKKSKEIPKNINLKYSGILQVLKKELKNISIDIKLVLAIGFLWSGQVKPNKQKSIIDKVKKAIAKYNIDKILINHRGHGYKLLLLPDSIKIIKNANNTNTEI